MRKKILVRGPALSHSGYGEQTRFALRSLRTREDIFDIYLLNIPWGQNGWIARYDEEREWLDNLIIKTVTYNANQPAYDVSLQVTIPNEWEKMAPVNIGYTAGIETNKVSPQWIEKSKLMDKIIVVSEHAKNIYETTVYQAENPQTKEVFPFRCTTPITPVNYAVRPIKPEPIDLNLSTDFNFLTMAQWGPRKNIGNTIAWFCEEFNDDPDVGLIVKTHQRNASIMDRYWCVNTIKNNILNHFPDKKCKIHLLHGDLSEGQLQTLYTHKKIKAMVTLSHGEGFGLPLFEAAYNGLPILAPDWSGYRDFLYAPVTNKKTKKEKIRPLFSRINYNLHPIQEEAVWDGVLQAESSWAFADEHSYKRKLRELYKEEPRFRSQAKRLKTYIKKNFTEEQMYSEFVDAIHEEDNFELDEWLSGLNVEEHK
jgi:glycosyltransferase involved in cell wall biosynthesis|tara:strand:+ start:13407 stop:14678 length:1272 start_codon:yes stop_codon:yes gene_type:complete